MIPFLIFLAIVFAPRFILSLAVPQALARGVAMSIWLFGGPVAAVWFALKSQMIHLAGDFETLLSANQFGNSRQERA
jgi:hypothetical protein